MSWLSSKWDELTGKNQKVDLGTITDEYNAAFGTGREQLGFEGEGLGAVGREMMDPNSARNQAAKAQMEQTQMNARSNQRQANAQIDSQATGFGANLLGKGLGAMFNPMSAVPIPGIGGQRGGAVGYQTGGMPYDSSQRSDLRTNYNRIDEMPERTPLPSPQDYDRRDRYESDAFEEYGPTEYGQKGDMNRLQDDGYMLNEGEELREKMLQMQRSELGFQRGGDVTPNTGGMLSQIMGPDGIPIHIRTRIGGQTIGQ